MKSSRLLLILIPAAMTLCGFAFPGQSVTPEEAAAPKSWREQLECALSNSPKTAADSDAYLLGYTYIGVIQTQGEIAALADEMFSDNSMIVQHTSFDRSQYVITSIAEIRQMSGRPDGSVDPFESFKQQFIAAIQPGMELVSLRWSYKGDTIVSTAIVSDSHGGFFYDNIGTFLLKKRDDPAGVK